MSSTVLDSSPELADRSDREAIQKEHKHLSGLPFVTQLLESFPESAALLNAHRQIVLCNSKMYTAMGFHNDEAVMGARLGEHFQCVNAKKAPSGCGTAEECAECGAMIAILASQDGRAEVEECHLTVRRNGSLSAADFRVVTTPLDVEGTQYSIVSLIDISHERRRRVLERIFFHDVLNTVGGIYGLSRYFPMAEEEEDRSEIITQLERASTQLLNEIESQRDLLAAENEELVIKPQEVIVHEVFARLEAIYSQNRVADDRNFVLPDIKSEEIIIGDPVQLIRCLGNLVKNAFEASEKGETVTLDYTRKGRDARFVVHNQGVIPPDAQLQIFQRSFTTKGNGRGVGTYSVKLIVENFLHGRVWFESSSESGTYFYIEIPVDFGSLITNSRKTNGTIGV